MVQNQQHFAIGLTVQIKTDALPSGFEDEQDEEHDYGNGRVYTIHAVDVTEGQDTYEVFGWWWKPESLVVVG